MLKVKNSRRRAAVEVRRLGPSDARCLKVAHAALFSRNRALNKKRFIADCVSGESTGHFAYAAHPKGSPGVVLGVCCVRLQPAESSQLEGRSHPPHPSTQESDTNIRGKSKAKVEAAADDSGCSSDRVTGGTRGGTSGQAAYVLSLGVYGPQRRRGVGTALIAHISENLCGIVPQLELHVHVNDDTAKAFYESCDFKVCRTVPQYYARGAPRSANTSDSSNDALLMARQIGSLKGAQDAQSTVQISGTGDAGHCNRPGATAHTDSGNTGSTGKDTSSPVTAKIGAMASRERDVASLVPVLTSTAGSSAAVASVTGSSDASTVPPLARPHTGKKRKISDFFAKVR